MGLDMYLDAKRYVGYGEDALSDKITQVADVPFGKVKEITAEVAYWRKANSIHKWFVDNIQDGVDECQESYVPRDKLEELRDLCKAVLADKKLANTLLPPASGFFFGSTDIDQGYFNDVQYTVEQLDRILDVESDRWSFSYRASW